MEEEYTFTESLLNFLHTPALTSLFFFLSSLNASSQVSTHRIYASKTTCHGYLQRNSGKYYRIIFPDEASKIKL